MSRSSSIACHIRGHDGVTLVEHRLPRAQKGGWRRTAVGGWWLAVGKCECALAPQAVAPWCRRAWCRRASPAARRQRGSRRAPWRCGAGCVARCAPWYPEGSRGARRGEQCGRHAGE
eukprot:3607067-Prymnesium_polylepis.1